HFEEPPPRSHRYQEMTGEPVMRTLVLFATAGIVGLVKPLMGQQPAAPAPAAPAPAPAPAPPSAGKLAFDAAFMNSSGNSRVTTFTTGQNFEVKAGRGAFIESGNAVYGRIGDSTTAEAIKVAGKIDYQLISILHGFVGMTYERNQFAGVDRRFQEVAGLA